MRQETIEQAVHIANGSIPDGYSGDRKNVQFWFDPGSGKTLVRYLPTVWSQNFYYHTHHNPIAIDAKEALWLLRNHPINNGIKHLREVTP